MVVSNGATKLISDSKTSYQTITSNVFNGFNDTNV